MKKFVFIIFMVGLAVLALIGNSEASSKDTFLVMTFNIRVGVGQASLGTNPWEMRNSPKVLDSIAEAIRSVDPDVIGLQEVLGVDQAKKLAKALNMNYVYQKHARNQYASWWGLAILSKHKIVKTNNYSIYYDGNKRYRARTFLKATINIKGKEIDFFNAHFQHEGNALKKQPKKAMKKISKSKNPVILLGDLNMKPEDPRFKPIKDKLKDSCEAVSDENSAFIEARGTFQGPEKDGEHKRIDYVFFDPKFFRATSVGILDKKYWPTSPDSPSKK